MKTIAHAARAFLGLFFDDGKLALAVLALLAFTAVVASAETRDSWLPMVLLAGGTVTLLLENVIRTADDSIAKGAKR